MEAVFTGRTSTKTSALMGCLLVSGQVRVQHRFSVGLVNESVHNLWVKNVPPTQKLLDELFLDKVRRARAQDPAERLLDGPRLFDAECAALRDQFHRKYPEANKEQLDQRVRRHFDTTRMLERNGIVPRPNSESG
jgi:hypothetical protein